MNIEAGADVLRPAKSPVTIKGTRNGLVFVLDDTVDFGDILADLEAKANGSHRQLFMGPDTPVNVQLGSRVLSEAEEQQIRAALATHPNLFVQSFQSGHIVDSSTVELGAFVFQGTVRSGQVVSGAGDVVVVGDVNPGGEVIAHGNVYVMGNLRGLAHAGAMGDETAVIAAVYFQPTQLRIGTVVSRPPDTWHRNYVEASMEFAYLRDGQMAVEKMSRLNLTRTEHSS